MFFFRLRTRNKNNDFCKNGHFELAREWWDCDNNETFQQTELARQIRVFGDTCANGHLVYGAANAATAFAVQLRSCVCEGLSDSNAIAEGARYTNHHSSPARSMVGAGFVSARFPYCWHKMETVALVTQGAFLHQIHNHGCAYGRHRHVRYLLRTARTH